MPLPELFLNSPTPGKREAYTTLEAELKTGETSMKWVLAPPAALRGALASGKGGQFRVVIGSEIILCEAGESKTVVIIERKAEGSAEAAQVNGSEVWIVPTNEGIKLASGSLTEVITSTKKWIKPKGAQFVTVFVIGGGGGGGSGASVAEKLESSGGGGGGGGALNTFTFPAAALAAEVECTVGKGGAGGKNRSTEGEGESGKAGEASHFGELLYADGGNLGALGKATAGGAAGAATTVKGLFPGNAGGKGGNKAAGEATPAPKGGGAGGGGGGGGPTTTESKVGGTGGFSLLGTEAKAATNVEGAVGLAESGLPGHGGGGGEAGLDASAKAGGKGGKYGGGGGGGGGCSLVGKTTGEGGAGGEGVIVIVTEF